VDARHKAGHDGSVHSRSRHQIVELPMAGEIVPHEIAAGPDLEPLRAGLRQRAFDEPRGDAVAAQVRRRLGVGEGAVAPKASSSKRERAVFWRTVEGMAEM
jgi:hypothetical protein